jgi:hypothetical protein
MIASMRDDFSGTDGASSLGNCSWECVVVMA